MALKETRSTPGPAPEVSVTTQLSTEERLGKSAVALRRKLKQEDFLEFQS